MKDLREQFEAWAKKGIPAFTGERSAMDNAQYKYISENESWVAWQACYEQMSSVEMPLQSNDLYNLIKNNGVSC